MNGKKNKLGIIYDVAFELVLVLLVLLAAMLLSKNDVIAPATGYSVRPVSLLLTFGLIAFYIAFMVKNSLKSIRTHKEDREEEK